MKLISQTKVIYEAFKDDVMGNIPKKESEWPDWYAERMNKCKECKFNTKNIPNRLLPVTMWVPKAMKQYRCAICTCFIDKKCWSKTEMCGLGETGARPDYLPKSYIESESQEPKWNRLEVVTLKDDDFDVISLEPELYNAGISEDGLDFKFDLKPTKKGEKLEFKFRLSPKHDIEFGPIIGACSCTSIKIEMTAEGCIDATMVVNTANFGIGRFHKKAYMDYSAKDGSFKNRRIEFIFEGDVYE